jgi:hypothetical protein
MGNFVESGSAYQKRLKHRSHSKNVPSHEPSCWSAAFMPLQCSNLLEMANPEAA